MTRIQALTAPFFAVPLLLASVTVQAMPIVQTAPCVDTTNLCATGITGLDVAGTLLDVDFVNGSSYNTLFASDAPYFLGDEIGAETALIAIATAFFAAGNIYGVNGEGSAGLSSAIIVPIEVDSTFNDSFVSLSETGSTDWMTKGVFTFSNSSDLSSGEPGTYNSYAVFTEARPVPAPATLLLFGLGLAGIGFGMRRR